MTTKTANPHVVAMSSDPVLWPMKGLPTGASRPLSGSNPQSGLASARSLRLLPIGVGLFEVVRIFDATPTSRQPAPFAYSAAPAEPPATRQGHGHADYAIATAPLQRPHAGAGTSPPATATVAEDVRAVDMVSSAQNALSLSITQIAGIVGVSRGTVYNWTKGVDVPRDEEKAARLRGLSKLGKEWRQRSAETLGRLLEAPVGPRDASLLLLLQAPTWDLEVVRSTMDLLADTLRARADRRQQAAAGTPHAVREITPENIQLERLRLRGLGR